jgi:predicted regulator of Ras-like GTPase activity (Roadblock/LC7/MglB family)
VASAYASMLDSLTRLRGVSASLLTSESDGMIIDSRLQVGQRGDRFAALAASLYRKARLASRAAGLGAVGFFQLDAEGGRICAVGHDDLVVVVVAGPGANVGLIRKELLLAAAGLGAV